MKPIIMVLFCGLACTAFCQVKVGVQAGYNLSGFAKDYTPAFADYYYHASSQSAFNAGIISSIPLAKRLSLQPSLLLSGKGAREKSGSFRSPYLYTHLRLYYAHLPVQVLYTFINRKQLQVSAGGGFFVSRGIRGTSHSRYRTYRDSTGPYLTQVSNKVNYTSNLYYYGNTTGRNIKPWDAGYTFAAAANWQQWQLKASYDLGIMRVLDISRHQRTSVFSLSAGYYFSKKKTAPAGAGKPGL